jgi:hypothetical protein
VDLVIDLDPIPIDFWHRRFPKRIPRGLILARSIRPWELASKPLINAGDLNSPRPSIGCGAGRSPSIHFNFYDEQYTGIQDAP